MSTVPVQEVEEGGSLAATTEEDAASGSGCMGGVRSEPEEGELPDLSRVANLELNLSRSPPESDSSCMWALSLSPETDLVVKDERRGERARR